MALSYGFFNSLSGDRKYNADHIDSIFDGIISDGVFQSIGNVFRVIPGIGLQVLVQDGKAWFNHTWTLNTENYPINLTPADPYLRRIDAIVLEVNHNTVVRNNSLKVITGTPAATPSNPTTNSPTDSLCAHHVLAYVTVDAGATSIPVANINIRVGQTECPYVSRLISVTSISEFETQWAAQYTADRNSWNADFNSYFATWQSRFTTWFDGIQAQATEKAVTNLQTQIDTNTRNINAFSPTIPATYMPLANKATQAETVAVADNSKYVTPYALATTTPKYLTLFSQPYTIIDAVISGIAGSMTYNSTFNIANSSAFSSISQTVKTYVLEVYPHINKCLLIGEGKYFNTSESVKYDQSVAIICNTSGVISEKIIEQDSEGHYGWYYDSYISSDTSFDSYHTSGFYRGMHFENDDSSSGDHGISNNSLMTTNMDGDSFLVFRKGSYYDDMVYLCDYIHISDLTTSSPTILHTDIYHVGSTHGPFMFVNSNTGYVYKGSYQYACTSQFYYKKYLLVPMNNPSGSNDWIYVTYLDTDAYVKPFEIGGGELNSHCNNKHTSSGVCRNNGCLIFYDLSDGVMIIQYVIHTNSAETISFTKLTNFRVETPTSIGSDPEVKVDVKTDFAPYIDLDHSYISGLGLILLYDDNIYIYLGVGYSGDTYLRKKVLRINRSNPSSNNYTEAASWWASNNSTTGCTEFSKYQELRYAATIGSKVYFIARYTNSVNNNNKNEISRIAIYYLDLNTCMFELDREFDSTAIANLKLDNTTVYGYIVNIRCCNSKSSYSFTYGNHTIISDGQIFYDLTSGTIIGISKYVISRDQINSNKKYMSSGSSDPNTNLNIQLNELAGPITVDKFIATTPTGIQKTINKLILNNGGANKTFDKFMIQ